MGDYSPYNIFFSVTFIAN